jgi:TonB family protein
MALRRMIVPLLAASLAQPLFAQTASKDPIGAARDLYASARYDEALAVLNDLRPAEATSSVNDRKSIEQYRSLCLLALGRGPEAENAIAAVIVADPNYLPSESEASPRVRAAFSEVRKRLLPDLATARYAEAKALFDRKEFKAAADKFRGVLGLLDDPDMGGRLPDLRTLSKGFVDLSTAAAAPPPESPKQPVAPPAPVVPQPDPRRVYTMEDRDVIAPVALRQDVPRPTPVLMRLAQDRGVIELVIDEQGRVTSMVMRQSIHPQYDAMLLAAARDWKYQPATVQGKPVKYRKLIQINLTR